VWPQVGCDRGSRLEHVGETAPHRCKPPGRPPGRRPTSGDTPAVEPVATFATQPACGADHPDAVVRFRAGDALSPDLYLFGGDSQAIWVRRSQRRSSTTTSSTVNSKPARRSGSTWIRFSHRTPPGPWSGSSSRRWRWTRSRRSWRRSTATTRRTSSTSRTRTTTASSGRPRAPTGRTSPGPATGSVTRSTRRTSPPPVRRCWGRTATRRRRAGSDSSQSAPAGSTSPSPWAGAPTTSRCRRSSTSTSPVNCRRGRRPRT